MADAADIANNFIDAMLEHSLQSRRRYQGLSATHCSDCDEEIPQARRDAIPGVERCVYCQELKERR